MSQHRAFSLIEMIIVMAILGILAAIVIPRFTMAQDDAEIASIQNNIRAITLASQNHFTDHGVYPELDASNFVGQVIPIHPWDPTHASPIDNDTTSDATKKHPDNKLTGGADGPYWHNVANGTVCSRIPDQGDAAANLKLYNEVNRSELSAF